jgi:formylglycine-generating enzyme required for sulfatase activity
MAMRRRALPAIAALFTASVALADAPVASPFGPDPSDAPPARSLPAPRAPERGAPSDANVAVLRSGASDRVYVAGGPFRMGSDPLEITLAISMCAAEPSGRACRSEAFAREVPVHTVTLRPYEIGRREVTVAAYERCVGAGVCDAPWYAAGGKRYEVPNFPVTMVRWDDAKTYCAWAGGRLPTEAEWERATRGTRGRRFPWGNVYDRFVVNGGRFAIDGFDDRDGFEEMAPVGSFPAGRTPEGIDDLAGNVEEWVADYFGDYPEGPVENPAGPNEGEERVLRGGSFGNGAAWLRGAYRGHDLPSARRFWRGFRCAWDVVP